MPSWIDFKELRAALSFEAVLKDHGVEPKLKNGQHVGLCPLPSHEGKRRAPSFSANMERKIFNCFGCGAKGNVLDFVALMERADPKDGRELKRVALALRKKYRLDQIEEGDRQPEPRQQPEAEQAQMELPTVVNPPLDFELQGLDAAHPYLKGRGFAEATAKYFGVGYCARGYLAGRVAIPLHDPQGQLVGYAGRGVDDSVITEDNPRYRFPAGRERAGSVLSFKKSLFLYNGFRLAQPLDHLGVVAGFPSVWWLHQHGYPSSVATMGSDCSDEQADLIVRMVRPRGHVWIIPDGGKAGERYAHSLLCKVSPHRFVRWVRLAEGRQPTDLSPDEMKACFSR